MFKEAEHPQLEFFKNQKKSSGKSFFFKKKLGFQRHAVSFLLYYENLVLLAIAFILILIVAFSLGVERGKRLQVASGNFVKKVDKTSEQKVVAGVKIDVKEEDVVQKKIEETPAVVKKEKVPVANKSILNGSYLIQVVTYSNRKRAEREMDKLLKSGLSGFIVASGRYYQVKAGPFHNKYDALKHQKQLKKTYKDCYIRRQP